MATLFRYAQEVSRTGSAQCRCSRKSCSDLLHLAHVARRRARRQICTEHDPADVIGMRALLLAILNGSGDIKRAQGVLATFPSANDLISSSASGIVASVTGDRAYTFVFARDFETALKVWDTSADTAADQRRRLSAKATIRALAGD